MKRIASLVSLILLSTQTAWASGTAQDMQTQMMKMHEAQTKMMAAMMTEKPSRLGFAETVAALQEAAKKRGWEVGAAMDMQAVMRNAGQKDAKPFTVLPMCKKDLAEDLLKAQAANRAMPFAPCRMSVFEGNDGKVYIAKPNTEMMAQVALPAFAPLLKQFAEEERALLSDITR